MVGVPRPRASPPGPPMPPPETRAFVGEIYGAGLQVDAGVDAGGARGPEPDSKRELTVYDCVLLLKSPALKTVVGIPRRDAELGVRPLLPAMTPAQLQPVEVLSDREPRRGRIPRLLKEHPQRIVRPEEQRAQLVACGRLPREIAW